ncbi:MAG TPA: hypothetical protein PL016_03100 [Kiritimatiellia bacterium]|nr:hypothetical protein [Kiritimatiellia bacterium]
MLGIWVKRSLRYYGLRQVLFAATAALTTAILSAALLTGESLRRTLARGVTARLGTIRSVILRDAGPFPATLADRLPDTQAVLLLNGELLTSEGIVCDARAQILGAGGESADRVDTDRVWMAALNARAARRCRFRAKRPSGSRNPGSCPPNCRSARHGKPGWFGAPSVRDLWRTSPRAPLRILRSGPVPYPL